MYSELDFISSCQHKLVLNLSHLCRKISFLLVGSFLPLQYDNIFSFPLQPLYLLHYFTSHHVLIVKEIWICLLYSPCTPRRPVSTCRYHLFRTAINRLFHQCLIDCCHRRFLLVLSVELSYSLLGQLVQGEYGPVVPFSGSCGLGG